MEEKVFSAEHTEEVIDLLEIVSPSVSEESSECVQPDDEIIELMPDLIEKPADGEHIEPALSEAEEEPAPAAASELSEEPAPVVQSSAVEEEALREPLFLPAEYASIADERFAALEQRIFAQEEIYLEELEKLEARLSESERKCEALSVKVDELQQQLSECSANFLEDASLRLALEEMVSRMLDARMPAAPEQEEGDAAVASEKDELQEDPQEEPSEADSPAENLPEPAENEQEQEELETVADESAPEEPLEVHENMDYDDRIRQLEDRVEVLEALEKRVAEWESRCEQEAALAAARIIREEIAVMRAASARSGL